MAYNSLRSSKKMEGLSTRSSKRNNIATPNHDTSPKTQQLSNIGRKKRRRDSTDALEPAISIKKPKLAVEILSRSKTLPKTRSLVIQKQSAEAQPSPTPPPKQTTKATQTEPAQPPRKHTNHREKVVNGIKHELDKLGGLLGEPQEPDLKDDKRKLRSQEGARFKSELSAYFPEYDEVIGNEPKEDHILNLDTPMIVVDTAKLPSKHSTSSNEHSKYPLKEFPDELFNDLYEAKRVDFSFLAPQFNDETEEDPLSSQYFVQIHRKPERSEKTIRNADKGRAQHEKDQVIRLLEGLQGHDWLKLMGVSGITESKKKDYEPARTHFIKGCEAILEKFRIWRDEEKRRKLAKEQAMAEASVDTEQGHDNDEEDKDEDEDEDEDGNISDGDPPDYSDVDASAARQLHDEAIARSAPLQALRASERRAKVELVPLSMLYMERDFISFFKKPHLREAALGKHRRSGRSAAAWGHPVPEMPENEFDLPEEFRDEDTLKAHARRKRANRRVSKD